MEYTDMQAPLSMAGLQSADIALTSLTSPSSWFQTTVPDMGGGGGGGGTGAPGNAAAAATMFQFPTPQHQPGQQFTFGGQTEQGSSAVPPVEIDFNMLNMSLPGNESPQFDTQMENGFPTLSP